MLGVNTSETEPIEIKMVLSVGGIKHKPLRKAQEAEQKNKADTGTTGR